MDKEKLIKQIMVECEKDGEPITRKEAEEMADMELKAKKDCRRYESNKTARKKPQKEKKIDTEKVEIINFIANFLKCCKLIIEKEKIAVVNPQKEITFYIGENNYSITLIKHRNKKKERL